MPLPILWQDAARRLLTDGALRGAHELAALLEESRPGNRAAQYDLSKGTGDLSLAEIEQGERLYVLQRPVDVADARGRYIRCPHCRHSHRTVSLRELSGRVDHPLRIFFVLWLLRTLAGGSARVGQHEYTVEEIARLVADADVRMVPVSSHYAQAVTAMASQLRLGYSDTAALHNILCGLCFCCGELRMEGEMPTLYPVDAFALLSRAPPCTSLRLPALRWDVRRLTGVSLLFLAVARLVHSPSAISSPVPELRCVFSLTPANADILDPVVMRSRSTVTALFALFSVLRCYTPGCSIRQSSDRSPVPGLSEEALGALVDNLAEVETVAGTLAALCRFELMSGGLDAEDVAAMLQARDRMPRGPPRNDLTRFLSTSVVPAAPELAVYPNRELDGDPRYSLVVSFPAGRGYRLGPRVEWAHASAVASAKATVTAADDAFPALRAVEQSDSADPSGRIDFRGLGFCSGSLNLDFAVPDDIPFADLRIDPGIFPMISKAPILTRKGSRTAWRVLFPPRRVLTEMVLSISRYMGGINRVVLQHILRFLNVCDLWSPVCVEDYVDWLFAMATRTAPGTHCHPIQYVTADLSYPAVYIPVFPE